MTPNVNNEPLYDHDCDNCTFLGTYDNHDLYHCISGEDGAGETLIARWGSDGPDYYSGMIFGSRGSLDGIHPWLRVAFLLAKDCGLVKNERNA